MGGRLRTEWVLSRLFLRLVCSPSFPLGSLPMNFVHRPNFYRMESQTEVVEFVVWSKKYGSMCVYCEMSNIANIDLCVMMESSIGTIYFEWHM